MVVKYVLPANEWGSRTVKGLRFLPYLQANKLSNYSFMLVEDMRLWVTDKREFITYSNSC